MTSKDKLQIFAALTTAAAIFVIAIILPRIFLSGNIVRLMSTQGLELFLSLLAILLLGRGRFSDYGFRRPELDRLSPEQRRSGLILLLISPLLGVAATVIIVAVGGKGNPISGSLTLPQIILFAWVFSSIIEEIFTRGFLQGHLSSLSGRYARILSVRIELPVLISAAFFACMHFSLLLRGTDLRTFIVIILFTFSLGLLAGYLRAQTKSLLPAIIVHMLANIGGVIGGIIYFIFRFLLSGN
jgi:membrane protease YdiL (CAAX protease family)